MGAELLLRAADSLPESTILYELERTVRAVREHPNNKKFKQELVAICMLFVSKDALKDTNIETLVKESEQLVGLHKMFTGRDN